jgi:hypothetical protein
LANTLQALVSVYRKILEFYKVAFEILTKKGARLAMRMVLERDHLPEIVQDFLKRADTLRKLVQKSTWEIVEDVRSMLYGRESKISSFLQITQTLTQDKFRDGYTMKR